jgi:hypothetical protein
MDEPNERESGERRSDLEERTAKFGEAVIEYLRSIPKDVITARLISQILPS